jgi:glycosyl transferase family 2
MRPLTTFHQDLDSVQRPFDAAVVIPTVLRPTLKDAVRSVFRQSFPGRLQIVIGVDRAIGDPAVLDEITAERPPRHAVTVLDPGYSVSARHGGVHQDGIGGTLRTILSYIANSRYVAYLDDDNWYGERHIERLLAAIPGHDWAFSLRWFVDEATRQPIGVDTFESIGPGQGVYSVGLGGWVDPNCLMLDKLACDPVLRCWSQVFPFRGASWSSDRRVFDALKDRRWVCTGEPSAFYVMHPGDRNHADRMKYLRKSQAEAAEASTGAPRRN